MSISHINSEYLSHKHWWQREDSDLGHVAKDPIGVVGEQWEMEPRPGEEPATVALQGSEDTHHLFHRLDYA